MTKAQVLAHLIRQTIDDYKTTTDEKVEILNVLYKELLVGTIEDYYGGKCDA